jgi:hypothetical protein
MHDLESSLLSDNVMNWIVDEQSINLYVVLESWKPIHLLLVLIRPQLQVSTF